MVNSENRRLSDVDPDDVRPDSEESIDFSSTGAETSANALISRRLTAIFLEGGDEDLLLQTSDKENGALQWLRALGTQVVGACRADERLKPLLKLNFSIGEAEDRLLAQLGEHFEPSEVGLLARGTLCLTLLPTSDLRISFNGDDGSVERLATLTSEAQFMEIDIQEISADKSCRSFLIKTSDGAVHYFWCSEKSQLLGNELLRKMKDMLMKKPLLADLTGISEARLNSFATHLRAYLSGLTTATANASGAVSASGSSDDDSFDSSEVHFTQSSFTSENNSWFPLSSSKDGPPESSSSGRNSTSEKSMLQGEETVLHVAFASTYNGDPSFFSCFQKDKVPETSGPHPLATLNFLKTFVKPAQLPLSGPNVPSSSSPLYCWCPPVVSSLGFTIVNSQLPTPSTESLSLPPFSSLLSKSSLNFTDLPPMDLPGFLPDSLIRLPSSQQIPTFTPLMCDPIIHIPVINVCSSGPGYLVSAGAGIAPTIPQLNNASNAEFVVEKSARETLHMLISGTNQSNPQVLPCVSDVVGAIDDTIDEREKVSHFDAGI